MTDNQNALTMVNQLMNKGIEGFAGLSGAREVANTYINSKEYKNKDEMVDSLINWESSKNFTSGFLTGLGGAITLPVTIPTSLAASWTIQVRMCAAIAEIYGHNLEEESVKTIILLAIIGSSGADLFKSLGVKVGEEITEQLIKKLGPEIIKEINKQAGMKLISKAGEKSIMANMGKFIPVIGGLIGGGVDYYSCQTIGTTAKNMLKN